MSGDQVRIGPISGFPEWLPAEKLVEERFLSVIRVAFESFGYTPVETAAVERTEVITAKGVEQKEIYSLMRLFATPEEAAKKELSLHFDLTVPFARYVAQNRDKLVFPFKRYQIQKVWRGERPAQGRFREFYQCDIDAVGHEELPVSYDAELLEVIGLIFGRLRVGPVRMQMNHRKLLEGFYAHAGVGADLLPRALLEVDKLDKTGRESVARQLVDGLGLAAATAERILAFAALEAPAEEVRERLAALDVPSDLFTQGADDLAAIADLVPYAEGVSLVWKGSITRGLNYYTGSVFETVLENSPGFGSICSGGRYENLAAQFGGGRMPGVGISIGLTRLLSYLFQEAKIAEGVPSTPTEILIAQPEEGRRRDLVDISRQLRAYGRRAELFPPAKLKKSLAYANKKGIPFVILPALDAGLYELKEMQSGRQQTLSRDLLLFTCKALPRG